MCNVFSYVFIENIRFHLHFLAVDALRTIKGSLIDTNANLSNWDRGDPCTSNWTESCAWIQR